MVGFELCHRHLTCTGAEAGEQGFAPGHSCLPIRSVLLASQCPGSILRVVMPRRDAPLSEQTILISGNTTVFRYVALQHWFFHRDKARNENAGRSQQLPRLRMPAHMATTADIHGAFTC